MIAVHRLDGRRVVVELDFEAAEFIALELPQGDGFTRDWWSEVYNPMLGRQDDEARRR